SEGQSGLRGSLESEIFYARAFLEDQDLIERIVKRHNLIEIPRYLDHCESLECQVEYFKERYFAVGVGVLSGHITVRVLAPDASLSARVLQDIVHEASLDVRSRSIETFEANRRGLVWELSQRNDPLLRE